VAADKKAKSGAGDSMVGDSSFLSTATSVPAEESDVHNTLPATAQVGDDSAADQPRAAKKARMDDSVRRVGGLDGQTDGETEPEEDEHEGEEEIGAEEEAEEEDEDEEEEEEDGHGPDIEHTQDMDELEEREDHVDVDEALDEDSE
jgi:DNA polymerase epsilon subunit 3